MREDTIPVPPLTPGYARALSPLVRRVTIDAGNNELGINTYLIGIDEVAVFDPGTTDQEHLDVLIGCGSDRIRWIVLSSADEKYSAGAVDLRKTTGAEILAPESFSQADVVIKEGMIINATEYKLHAVPTIDDNHLDNFIYVLEQERMILSGPNLPEKLPDSSIATIRNFRAKSLAPGEGQYIEDVRKQLEM